MKKIIISLLVLANLISCNWIDVEPETTVTYTNFYKTEEDAEALLVSILGAARTFSRASNSYHGIMGAIIDEINKESSYFNSNGIRMMLPTDVSEDNKSDTWASLYVLIHKTYFMIDEEARFMKNGEISRERMDFYLQQAHFFRAVAFFNIAQTWGDAPIIPSHLFTAKLGRSSKELVLEEAIKSAEIAMNLPNFDKIIDCKGKAVASKMWASKGVVAALLADIYAWRGALLKNNDDTNKAIKYCTDIIDGKYGTYTCAGSPEAVCREVMTERRSLESIWEIDIFQSDFNVDINNNRIYPLSVSYIGHPVDGSATVNKKMNYVIYAKTINELYEKQDLRRTSYFYEIDTPVDGYKEEVRPAFFYKWRKIVRRPTDYNPFGYVNIDCNRVYYRLAGIILLRAECRNRAGDIGGATEDLNRIRGYANAIAYPNGNMDSKGLAYAIFKEFDKELFMERERYYDVVRNGYWNTDMNPSFPKLSDADVKNGALYLPMTKSAIRQGNDLLIETTFWSGR